MHLGLLCCAQKLELYAHYYYYGGTTEPCYTWPAIGCDSYARQPGIGYNGTNVGPDAPKAPDLAVLVVL